MPQICEIHNVEMRWIPDGISKKTGKSFKGFWSCGQRNIDGSFCNWKPPKPQTNSTRFNQDLNRSESQMNQIKKDESIMRQVAAKVVGCRLPYSEEALEECDRWVDYMRNGRMKIAQEEIEDIPWN